MAQKVPLIVCVLGRTLDPFTLHIYAALAERERRMNGQRTSARLAAAKGRVEDRTRVADQSARLRRTRDDHTG